MGIEHIARAPLIDSNHGVASTDDRCARFLCEKRCLRGQHQPIRVATFAIYRHSTHAAPPIANLVTFEIRASPIHILVKHSILHLEA
jgi:hypothetical protein